MKFFTCIYKPLLFVFTVLIIQLVAYNRCVAQSPVYFATTAFGGNQQAGSIIRFNPVTDSESVVWNFSNVYSKINDGCVPTGSLVYDSINGLFYGTLKQSAVSFSSWGYIFSFNPLTNAENIVWSFGGSNLNDGGTPLGSLTLDTHNGLYYGTTSVGGVNNSKNGGNGTIFSFNPANDSEKTVWSFGDPIASTDGYGPTGDLVYNAKTGLFYGMTPQGPNSNGKGVIFGFNPTNNQETVLWTFKGAPSDGTNPAGSFFYNPGDGLYYAVTALGGSSDSGAIISFNPLTNEEKLAYRFKGGMDGNDPRGNITYNPDNGLLYGITEGIKAGEYGTLFSFNPSTGDKETLHHFGVDSTDGISPVGSLLYNADSGLFYGMTGSGGLYEYGGIFSFNPTTSKVRMEYSFIGGNDGNAPEAGLASYIRTTVHTISVDSVLVAKYCGGSSITVPFSITGKYNAGNVFTAQISDFGNFDSYDNIGTLTSTTAGTITGTIPLDEFPDTLYRIRVVSSNPALFGSENGHNITVRAGNVVMDNPFPGSNQIAAGWESVPGVAAYFLDVSLNPNFTSFVSGYNNLNVGSALAYNITGLKPATTYYYRVRINNACGVSGNSRTVTCTTAGCGTLTGGTVTPASVLICADTTQLLTVTGASAAIAQQWQISSDNISWANVSSGGTGVTYLTSPLDGRSKKYYRCLSSSACYTAASATATVEVSAPINLVSSVTDNSATLNWSPAGVENYWVSYTGPTSGTEIGVKPPVTYTGLAAESKYTFTITQVTPTACTHAETFSVVTLCGAPSFLQVETVAANSISISWEGVYKNCRIYYTPVFSSSTATKTLDVDNGSTATIQGLLPGVTYKIYVAQKDCPSTGDIGQPSAFIYATTKRTSTCTAPVIDSVKSICSGQVQVWLHGNSNKLYTIYLQRLTPVLQPANSYSISGNNLTISPSVAGQTYLLAASSNCGTQSSNLTIWQAGINVPAPCNALNNLLLSEPTCADFTASWNADNCNSNTLSSYALYVRKQGAIAYNSYAVPPANSYKVVSGLLPNTTYQCFVRTAYSCSTYLTYGPASAVQTITTQSAGCRTEENDEPATEPAPQQTVWNENETFTLYPNPNTGQFIINLNRLTTEDESVHIEVLNMLGQTVLTQLTIISNGHLNEFINLPNSTSAGMYVVRVVAGKNIYTSKVNIDR